MDFSDNHGISHIDMMILSFLGAFLRMPKLLVFMIFGDICYNGGCLSVAVIFIKWEAGENTVLSLIISCIIQILSELLLLVKTIEQEVYCTQESIKMRIHNWGMLMIN